jgi:NitT/TauT family transport system ATP-binding protein
MTIGEELRVVPAWQELGHRAGRPAARPKVVVDAVAKRFRRRGGGDIVALDRMDLTIADGQFCCLVGPSGCGKSTLLRILASLDDPSDGAATIYQDDDRRPLAAVVFQEQSVLPWMTVERNVAYGLAVQRVPKERRERQIDYYLTATGLDAFRHQMPYQLSGGMRQRVSVARAFATDAEILLMDEPFGALDEQTRMLMQEELLRLWEQHQKTVLFITHSIDEALVLADRIVVMSARPGRVIADIDVPFERPRAALDIRTDPRHAQLTADIWQLLRGEVVRAGEEVA